MKLTAGTRLGPYEILAPIGAGGMGEVYKARDTRLDRTVAIKVSKEQFPERFEREARAVAALNHPHICHLYDVGPNYLVMEHIDGQPLRGPYPLQEAVQLAVQIADALETAHRHGIVHRDLKPANILVAKSGVKLLDFGLVRFTAQDAPHGEAATKTLDLTQKNTILGTLQYMSPEQLEAKPADARSDIFSFGLVLYEMLTGRRAFEASSQASLIAAIIGKDPPPVSSLEPLTPKNIDYVLKTCLAKDPDDRWQTAREVKRELLRGVAESPAPVTATQTSLLPYWVAIAMLAAAAIGVSMIHFREKRIEAPVQRFSVGAPEKAAFTSPVSVSPDGRRFAFAAVTPDGRNQLWVRAIDAIEAQPLAGTDRATNPFWSPDSASLGFFADGKLKRIDASGGSTRTLSDAPNGRGGSWSKEGVIVFAPNVLGPLHRVSAAGGISSPVTRPDSSLAYSAHRWPWFLPDGRHFLYVSANSGGNAAVGTTVRVGSLNAGEAVAKVVVESQFNAVYAQGYLLFLRGNTLVAHPFDPTRLVTTADALPLVEQVQTLSLWLRGVFSVSENGLLVYRAGVQSSGAQLAWFDRGGKPIGTLGERGLFGTVHLAPDGKNATVSLMDAATRHRDVWIYDAASGLRTRFTFDPAEARESAWSPDSSKIVFNSNRKGTFDLYEKRSNGSGAEELLWADNLNKYPSGFSPDGKTLSYWSQGDSKNKTAIWILPLTNARKPYRFSPGAFDERWGKFSPDGRWIVYQSNESQRDEIYIASFPGPGGKRQISFSGGEQPIWRSDGKEIFYLAPGDRMMAAEVNTTGDTPAVGAERPLFSQQSCGAGYCYDVSADGQRFLLRTEPDASSAEPLTVVQNWTAGLRK